ncbi:MAG: hypothetical protein IPL75_11055 [Acidobacteria bacterium]|nr:hypothetical protein [Acidobacteriota bacterium]
MTFPEFGASVGVAFITAAVTVWLTRRQAFSEKWWERKAEAYSEILKALAHMAQHQWVELAEANRVGMSDSDDGPDEKAARVARYETARLHIEHVTAIGAFIISAEVVGHLRLLESDFNRALHDSSRVEDFFKGSLDAIHKATAAIRESANKELHHGWSRWPI